MCQNMQKKVCYLHTSYNLLRSTLRLTYEIHTTLDSALGVTRARRLYTLITVATL